MKAIEFKLATKWAKDTSKELPWELCDCLFGCGCPDFAPKCVSLKSVASMLRYQCLCLNGAWDEDEYQNMRAIFVLKGRGQFITVSDVFADAESRELIHELSDRTAEALVAGWSGQLVNV